MTTPEIITQTPPTPADEKEERKRRTLLLILLILLVLICAVSCLFLRYLLKPEPISDIVPIIPVTVQSPPTYVKMFMGVDAPVAVAVSPDAQRIYVSESMGDRLVKAFDRDGKLLFSFAPPFTEKTNRAPGYLAVAADGKVFVSDRYNGVIAVFDADGNFIDALIGTDMTLSKYLKSKSVGILPPGSLFYYNIVDHMVVYQIPGGNLKALPGPDRSNWNPLGVHFDAGGDLMLTNLISGRHEVLIFPAASLQGDWSTFSPTIQEFGLEGNQSGQLSFPNSVTRDNQGNYYVSDGNNGRISAWSTDRIYKSFFGFGSSEQSLNLPRGMWMDNKDRLHVADAVGQAIRVYQVSGADPIFLYSFGDFGITEGYFNYPVDVCLDSTGRVYVADRENNRVDIWSY